MSYPVPADEIERLAHLRRYRILDTLPEREYDDLVQLASVVCGTPIAQVNFVDAERQWQKASLGLPAGSDPRSVSFCAHAIVRPQEIFEVQDARKHPVLRDYPGVTGVPYVVFYAAAPLVTRSGSAIGTLCVVGEEPQRLTPAQADALRALARQVVALLELRVARLAAEEAAEQRSRFLATMSHEIRTPLNGVLGMAEILADAPLQPAEREIVDTLAASGRHLLGVVNGVLDLASLESGQLRFERAPFRAASPFEAAAAMMRPSARAKGLTLALDLDGLEREVEGDETRLRQVTLNLLANAIKFTERGEIRLVGRLHQDLLRLEVHDTGLGIAPERITEIFDPFRQADPSVHRRFGGTGLGLAITRGIIEGQGGSIRVESETGRGSTFHVELPLPAAPLVAAAQAVPETRAAPGAAPAQHPGAEGPLRILVAEDNEVNRKVLEAYLRKLGHAPAAIAADGLDAVSACETAPFDLVLMDIQMPRMDGLAAAREILSRLPVPPRIVACTAHAMPEEERLCLAAGMDGYLTKPISRDRLEAILRTTKRRS